MPDKKKAGQGMKNISLARSAVLFSLLWLISGCASIDLELKPTASPDLRETSFLTGKPCAAPCWRGLKIGVSTYAQVMRVVSNLNYIDQKTNRVAAVLVPDLDSENLVLGKEITATCVSGESNQPCLRLTMANERLSEIEIILNADLTLSEVIARLGNPDYVGYINANTDQVQCEVELIWVEQQLSMRSKASSTNAEKECYPVRETGKPRASTIISNIKILPVKEINRAIKRDELTQYIGMETEP
jgi:hypothetical protein